MGVKIPEGFAGDHIGKFVKEIITESERNPYSDCGFSYTVAVEFSEAIRKAVNDYYGVDGSPYLLEE